MEKELGFDLKDVDYISVECPKCRTRLQLPLNPKVNVFIPEKCSGCNESYDSSGIQGALHNFRLLYGILTSVRQRVTIRISQDAIKTL